VKNAEMEGFTCQNC